MYLDTVVYYHQVGKHCLNFVAIFDFDGTIVDHCYPDIGKPVPGAISGMKELVDLGCKIILYTMVWIPLQIVFTMLYTQ